MHKRIFALLICTFFAFSSPVFSQTPYYPDTNWLVRNPESSGWNKTLLDSAVQFGITNEISSEKDLRIVLAKSYSNEPDYRIAGPVRSRGSSAGLIIHKGYIVGQWGDPSRVDMTFSVTKSFLSTVAGLTFDQHLIANVDEKVQTYVWDGSFDEKSNSQITWRHLLTQSSDWSGCQFGFCDWADRPPKEGTVEDWKNRKRSAPGTVFEYNDVRVNLLAYSLLQVWRKPLPIVLREKIMDPIGASTTWRWYGYDNSWVTIDGMSVQSVSGGGHFGGGMFINSFDMARFGLLFLRKGKWNGKQLISEQWIRDAKQPSAANKAYGFMWWTNQTAELKSAPSSLYYASGFGGNYIVIDEQHDLVVVVRWLNSGKLNELMEKIFKALPK